jgi:predicted enzyme related to lactoylglutathione lyase
MGNPVNFFQISAADGGSLQNFYKQVFAWKMSPGPSGLMMVASEKGGIGGGVGSSQNGASSVAVYVDVADVSAHLAKVEQAGGKTALPPTELPGGMGTIAGFLDPAGNWIGLWQSPKKVAKRAPARAPAKRRPKAAAKKKKGRKSGKR